VPDDEIVRQSQLLDAQARAVQLFEVVTDRKVIAPGLLESVAGEAIRELAADMFGVSRYIAPGNDGPMRRLDQTGRPCHWILEIHLIDRERQIGGFYEDLLDLRPDLQAA
jgi:hypothetical protein